MARHYEIKIKVAYDTAHQLPTVRELAHQVSYAVGNGLLNNMDKSSVVEEWDFEIEDKGD